MENVHKATCQFSSIVLSYSTKKDEVTSAGGRARQAKPSAFLAFFTLLSLFFGDKKDTPLQWQRCGPISPKPHSSGRRKNKLSNLTKALMEELTVEYVKVGPLKIPESVVISWVIMAIVVIGSILLTRNLKVDHISKRQAVLEMAYTAGTNFFEGLLGKEGKRYVPYLMTVAIYIAFCNLIGVFGVKPPTKDLDVTAALALMSIVLIEGAGIRARGGTGFLKSLAAPTPVMTPMNILEIAIRPTSLCMRLFGNVLGAFVIMELIKLVVPVFVPAVFSLYFDLFDGLIQTYVFVFLTSLFMKETIGDEEE